MAVEYNYITTCKGTYRYLADKWRRDLNLIFNMPTKQIKKLDELVDTVDMEDMKVWIESELMKRADTSSIGAYLVKKHEALNV